MNDDREIITLCWHIIGLFFVDYFELHGFGIETCLAVLAVMIIIYYRNREDKK